MAKIQSEQDEIPARLQKFYQNHFKYWHKCNLFFIFFWRFFRLVMALCLYPLQKKN